LGNSGRIQAVETIQPALAAIYAALTDDWEARFNTMGAQTMVVPYKREKRLAVNIAKLPLTFASAVGLRNDGIFRPLPSFVAKLRASIF
jgi:hypothetical protein